MKKALIIPLGVLLAATVLSGCTRTSYAIHTNDGRTIISDGKPKQQINKSEVKNVAEVPH